MGLGIKTSLFNHFKGPRSSYASTHIIRSRFSRKRTAKIADEYQTEDEHLDKALLANKENEEDHRLKHAATIGTALMVVNSHRALFTL
jgi:hypothetical protein